MRTLTAVLPKVSRHVCLIAHVLQVCVDVTGVCDEDDLLKELEALLSGDQGNNQ